ncbi:MAG: MCE family protein [candidate division Zixibacteria bacterium]|nr:MCE family protein [candidate division Zixibacteria bacterium]
MGSRNIELKVGLLVIAGAVIVIFAIWLAKGYRYGQEFYTVSVVFPEVGALAPGDPVAISGVNMGKVKEVSLYKGGVLTQLDIADDVAFKEDASFIVKNIGLMGERFIAAKTGKSDNLLDLSKLTAGTFDAGIPEVMGMMGDVIGQMGNLVTSLEKTVISPQTLDKFSATIDNLRSLTSRLESAAERNVPLIDSAIASFNDLSHSLNEGLKKNQPRLDNASENFETASVRFMSMLDDLDSASVSLKSFAADLDQSDGTLRMLLEDRRLYDDLRTTSHRLDSLVMDIRENPKKYINFTVELF